ncbi:putative Nitrate excretion transporter 1 [Hibiscus syriacus]|uniref:Nitrate excretion transporter 1 n=1 Tax=Hibiscus syriacus TaxID=106335 RepID=A0A6A3ADB5_HIBSY|nr:putative Nitrate excretion transporter 1 [Hibiscus syriacus]
MASPSSSSSASQSIFPEELKLFHTIDRTIFSRLVLNLQREPLESMHVMALLLWVERYVACGENLVFTIQTWPDTFVDALAIESSNA